MPSHASAFCKLRLRSPPPVAGSRRSNSTGPGTVRPWMSTTAGGHRRTLVILIHRPDPVHLEHRRAPVELFVWHEPVRHSEAQTVIVSFDVGDGRLLGAALSLHNPTPFSVGTGLASPAMLAKVTTVASGDESLANFLELRIGEVRCTRGCGSSGSDSASILRCQIRPGAIHAHKSGTATRRTPQTPPAHRVRNRCLHARGAEGTLDLVCRALFGWLVLHIWGSVSFSPPRALP